MGTKSSIWRQPFPCIAALCLRICHLLVDEITGRYPHEAATLEAMANARSPFDGTRYALGENLRYLHSINPIGIRRHIRFTEAQRDRFFENPPRLSIS